MIYNQNETERVLRQHLDATFNFRPEWGTQLLSLKQDESGIEVGLRLADGSKETIRPRWVIGADGVRSRVRECLGIAYEGEDYEENVLQMMDVGINDFNEIGRASCRERVCQYVSLSGGAGSLKKKK